MSDAFDLYLLNGDRPARESESPKSNAAGESPAPALASRVAALEAEVAELREKVERLLEATKG